MEYWKQVDFSMQSRFIFTHKLFEASSIINSTHHWTAKKLMVGYLIREYLRIAWYFLARGGSISVEASSHRRHCKQLCGRMEIKFPCWVAFTCSRMATLNWLKALLKVVIYANLHHSVQMFSQMSRIPDLIWKFWAKKCGVYAGDITL